MQLELKVGDRSFPIPDEVKAVTGVALVDLRGRRVPLKWLNKADFKAVALGRAEFRGVPTYYRVDGRAVHVWPLAAHQWKTVLTIEDTATQGEVDGERNLARV